MSNASNLSTLANVLDDGSDGQFLKSTGSGGVAFDTVAAGAVVYATADLLPLSGNSAGDMAYVTATNRFYINNGSGWYSVSLVNTNPNITSVQDASSNTTPFTLATDGTATVITVTAADPEEIPLTYGYSVTSGSLNGSTVAQGTGSNTNVFTVTPHASQDATFTLTFTASDGINQATSANAFSLSFVTVVTDSKYTTLLATATGTSDNNNITDSSSNSHSITVNGDAHAGTFSPYRSGGYSTYFDGNGDYLSFANSSSFNLGASDFFIGFWVNPSSLTDYDSVIGQNGTWAVEILSNTLRLWLSSGGGSFDLANAVVISNTLVVGDWTYVAIVRDSSANTLKSYQDGTLIYNNTNFTGTVGSSNQALQVGAYNGSYLWHGYLRDVNLLTGTDLSSVSTTAPTEAVTTTSETSLLTCHLPYITDGSSNDHSVTVNGDVSTKPFSPYDYNEYDAANHGGSVHFDGSGDRITASTSNNFAIGSSEDFIIEAWIYPTNTSQGNFHLFGITSATYNGGIYLDYHSSDFRIGDYGGGWDVRTTSSVPLIHNTWQHICASRTGNLIKIFFNGESLALSSQGEAHTNSYDAGAIAIGGSGAGADFQGFISDIRFEKGTSRTSNFNLPTAPLSSSGAELHIKGTDASIIDKSQRYNIDLGSTSIVGDSTTKWSGENSIYINSKSNSSDIITIPAGVLNASEPFTIEMWLKTNSGASSGFWAIYQDASNEMRLKMRGDDRIEFYHRGSGAAAQEVKDETNTYTLNNTDFYHVAITRDASAVFYLHQNGIKLGNFTANGNYDSSAVEFKIGTSAPGSSSYMNGYIQDFRITQGLARYTAADETSNIPSAPLEG